VSRQHTDDAGAATRTQSTTNGGRTGAPTRQRNRFRSPKNSANSPTNERITRPTSQPTNPEPASRGGSPLHPAAVHHGEGAGRGRPRRGAVRRRRRRLIWTGGRSARSGGGNGERDEIWEEVGGRGDGGHEAACEWEKANGRYGTGRGRGEQVRRGV
jgi:hypothetical protein